MPKVSSQKGNAMAAMTQRTCKTCSKPFQARMADVKRGWAQYCSKSCKAIKQEQRTGQFAALLSNTSFGDDRYDVDISDMDYGASDGD